MSGIWPGDTRCAVVLTFDIDGVSGAINVDPESARRPGLLSVREYGPSVGVPRILDLLDELDVPATFFVPGYVAETHEDMVREITRRGHETAHHGYMHEPPATLSRDEEIRRARPRLGHPRAPDRTGGLPGTVRRLRSSASTPWRCWPSAASLYDSSLMGNDVPYVVDAGAGRIVEVPTHWELNDVSYFNYAPQLGIRQYMATPEHVYSVWTSAFEGAYHYGRSLVLMMHPYVMGRPGRLRVLARLIRDMQSYPGVAFMRAIDAAEIFAP